MNANQLVARHDGTLEVTGPMTFQTVPEFVGHGVGWLDTATGAVTIDLAKTALVDSAGVALMLEWMAEARRRQRELRFINIPEPVRQLLNVSGLTRTFGL